MATKRKSRKKTLREWEVLVCALLILSIVVYIFIELRKPLPGTQGNPTLSSAEATLPPLRANPIQPEDFVEKDNFLHCLTYPAVPGIDVSFWQGQIDWPQVKAAGVQFAMIRVGGRSSDQGSLFLDDCVQANYNGASAAGLRIGAYFFSQAINPEEAVEEAEYLLAAIKNWKVDMPIVFDWEYISADARTGNVDARTLTDCAKAFCSTIAAAGYQPMIYFNTSQSFDSLYLAELANYPFWLAQYNDTLEYPYKIDMWQYTDQGSIPGINGYVDLNLYFPWED